ncbi:hypothetical protein CLAFUW4_09503 [Fulvia fulva]|uniref:Uncharacterized protein n=1 Tax=Passalora fulva TaxID=5499 RepID=A0A9Q8UTA1_PASFU|nr:uncharacterized protein CLAFUR5_09600 [Fulvia fulva]KAK4613896.1 hypothetical protein CLAFUR4_09509 [Fulvia fulva]KAK4615290.1 hypothetical protein CLAFUR0_09500 [Fulvia fulva]UJO21597.1 hypothetical protein CLAFUR5_09600 [Fulvia fulva]WPV20726.1 hypothetical protein CLAFUW4_09503 [Fulvia fulva]WPV35378.1 hypothetical protein CLAFUW7_09504 [Fulvia fulva]
MSALDVLQAAQLHFETPTGPQMLKYNISQPVNVTWRSPHDYTTVEVWQGPFSNGAYSTNLLVANATQDQNSLLWNTTSISGSDLSAPFFFRLQNGDAPNTCEFCTSESAAFRVSDPAVLPTTSSSTNTASTTPASGTASAVAATASSLSTAATSNSSDHSALGIGLGVGLGIGLGLILFLILLGLVMLKRRRKRQQAQARRQEALKAEPSLRDSLASGWTSKHSENTMSGMSTSGMSYHSRFEFEKPDGSIREGWERLFGPDGRVTYQRMPTRPGQAVIR